MITRVTGKNQVTVPAKLARELNIGPGTKLEWSRAKEEATIRIRVKPSANAVLCQVQEKMAAYHIDPNAALADLQRMRDEDDPEHSAEEGKAE